MFMCFRVSCQMFRGYLSSECEQDTNKNTIKPKKLNVIKGPKKMFSSV